MEAPAPRGGRHGSVEPAYQRQGAEPGSGSASSGATVVYGWSWSGPQGPRGPAHVCPLWYWKNKHGKTCAGGSSPLLPTQLWAGSVPALRSGASGPGEAPALAAGSSAWTSTGGAGVSLLPPRGFLFRLTRLLGKQIGKRLLKSVTRRCRLRWLPEQPGDITRGSRRSVLGSKGRAARAVMFCSRVLGSSRGCGGRSGCSPRHPARVPPRAHPRGCRRPLSPLEKLLQRL